MARGIVHVIAQHKPFSFLSPSPAARGNKRFAIDLLTRSNGKTRADQRAPRNPCELEGLQCAGRLDAESTGLMLWSTDRRFVERIIGPHAGVEKECEPRPAAPVSLRAPDSSASCGGRPCARDGS